MKKILFVFGTRPEAIKLAPLILKLSHKFNVKVCVTGQHREMLAQVLEIFDIVPDYDLELMKINQTLEGLTGGIISGVSSILKEDNFDWVIVQGDTTSTMAGALAAFYSHTPVAYVESGLRTHNLASPFPEELNRQITSRIANIHFAPTEKNKTNLINEGLDEQKIFVTGNTVVDALCWVLDNFKEQNNLFPFLDDQKPIVLVTGHRRENFGKGFINICHALRSLAENNNNLQIVYPVHLNPNVQTPVNQVLSGYTNIHLIPPLSYIEFVRLMNLSTLILTDSGGVQEEALSLGKPVLVMRDTTERLEGIESGSVKLIGTKKNNIVHNVMRLLDEKVLYNKMAISNNPYGDGKSCDRIMDIILKA